MKTHYRQSSAPKSPAPRILLALAAIAAWHIARPAPLASQDAVKGVSQDAAKVVAQDAGKIASQDAPKLAAQPAPKTKINPKDGLTYVWIAPAQFLMGCSPGDDNCLDDEEPRHTVTLTKGYWIGQTPVTQAAFQKVMHANPSGFHGDQLPVESVTWDESQNYCKAVGMRLPTEAEWEYAARAGTTQRRYADLDAIAWYMDNSGGTTHPVAQKQPNRFGLYDMLGNVSEWKADWYMPWWDGMISVDPDGPPLGQWRVVGGGSWWNDRSDIRVSYRSAYDPEMRSNQFGFRCVGN